MEIYPFDRTATDVFDIGDIGDIVTDGISIRTGNKVIHLQVTEETVIDDIYSVRVELENKFMVKYQELQESFNMYKEQMSYSLREEEKKLEKKNADIERVMRESSILPAINYEHMKNGLSVCSDTSNGGLVWSYKCVYAPTHIGSNRIDPAFSKRLVTPITIEVWTNSDQLVTRLVVRKILGNNKFQHYHSMSETRDCWGSFLYEGLQIFDPDKMIEFCRDAAQLLEVINNLSIGTRNPRGLPRLDTLEKHVMKPNKEAEPETINISTSTRNVRAGIDMESQATQSANDVWST